MVVGSISSASTSSKQEGLPSWITAAGAKSTTMPQEEEAFSSSNIQSNLNPPEKSFSDFSLSFQEKAFAAAGAAVLSAILVNPLDVAKTRLQAQAAGIPFNNIHSSDCFGTNAVLSNVSRYPSLADTVPACSSDSSRYKGTVDVLQKIVRQEGISRLWRGTNASLALAVPTVGIYMPLYDIFRNHMEELASEKAPAVMPFIPLMAGSLARTIACITCYPVELARTRMQTFKHNKTGVKPPGVWETLNGVTSKVESSGKCQTIKTYRLLWTGLGAQLARDVPFSAICWATLEPVRRRILGQKGDEMSALSVLGANFTAGVLAGSLAGAATCPLDVVRTRRQIEKDPTRVMTMSSKKTLLEVLRNEGIKGLFTGLGPRVARAGPSVGIVVSFYELVKYTLYRRHSTG